MVVACMISESYKKFKETTRVVSVIKKYGLPVYQSFDAEKVLTVMRSDKKKVKDVINYVLLQKIGKAVVEPITVNEITEIVRKLV